MGMTETEMLGVIVLACLVTAVIVRLLVGFAQRETDLRDCGGSGLYLDTGIAQTMGNKEIQSDSAGGEDAGRRSGGDRRRDRKTKYRGSLCTDCDGYHSGQI